MIMVVTHHSRLRTDLTEFLSQQGYEVLVPLHRHDVCSLILERNPQVIVLDFYVADPNALKIVEKVRQQGFTGKILIVAGASVQNAAPEVLRLGADQIVGGPRGNEEPLLGGQIEAAIRSFFLKEIQSLAYRLFEARGRAYGRDWDDWLEAERQILKRRKPSPIESHPAQSAN